MNQKEFLKWLGHMDQIPLPTETIEYNQWAADTGSRANFENWDSFVEFVLNSFGDIPNPPKHRIIINVQHNKPLTLASKYDSDFATSIQIISPLPVDISGFTIKNFHIVNGDGPCKLSNLAIDTLTISTSAADFRIIDCDIGTLVLNGRAVHDFEMHGGRALDIRCPPPTADSPFSGSVHFDRSVYLPRKPGIRLAGPQPYRNLRAHMLKLENAPMVTRFHSLEQAVERHKQGLFDKLVSLLYGALSDYGSSPVRPFLWFLGLLAFTFAIIFFSDGATPGASVDLKGWQSGLGGVEPAARAERALVLTMNSTLNPLAIFGGAGLLVAKYGWVTAWLAAHGLLSALFVVLFVFALRRRFKIT